MKLNYWEQLSKEARWRLPRKEADNLLSAYQRKDQSSTSTDTELILHFGAPQQLVMQQAHPQKYLVWLLALTFMSFCLLILPVEWFLGGQYFLELPAFPMQLLALGTVCSIGWFQCQGAQEPVRQLPLNLLRLLLILTVGITLVWCANAFLFSQAEQLSYWVDMSHGIISGYTIARLLEAVTLLSVFTGLFALIQARLGDRRWRAIYIVSLTSSTLSMASLRLWSNMDLSAPLHSFWYLPELIYFLSLCIIGLFGVLISLRFR